MIPESADEIVTTEQNEKFEIPSTAELHHVAASVTNAIPSELLLKKGKHFIVKPRKGAVHFNYNILTHSQNMLSLSPTWFPLLLLYTSKHLYIWHVYIDMCLLKYATVMSNYLQFLNAYSSFRDVDPLFYFKTIISKMYQAKSKRSIQRQVLLEKV